MRVIDLPDEAATTALAARLAEQARPGDVIALRGDLGSGKTTFARAFIRALGGGEEVPSPSFTLVQLYELAAATVWHFDLYRLRSPEEAWELGIEEAFAGGIALIEWPERLGALLPERRLDDAARTDRGRCLNGRRRGRGGGRWPPFSRNAGGRGQGSSRSPATPRFAPITGCGTTAGARSSWMRRRRRRTWRRSSLSRRCCAISASARRRYWPRTAGRASCCSKILATTPIPGFWLAAPTKRLFTLSPSIRWSPCSRRWRHMACRLCRPTTKGACSPRRSCWSTGICRPCSAGRPRPICAPNIWRCGAKPWRRPACPARPWFCVTITSTI